MAMALRSRVPSPAELPGTEADPVSEITALGAGLIAAEDPELHGILVREHARQAGTLSLVASCSPVPPSVLAAQSCIAVNVTAEGYPGNRYHAGCAVIDDIESLAISRAKALFGASYVNVQPHSATTANYAVLSALLRPGETLLGMSLSHGGHLTHGSPVTFSGQYFQAIHYGLDPAGRIDYAAVAELARAHRPKVIICGATAYSRNLDFPRFREIADSVDAYLLADISHTAGLVAAGLCPSPIDHAHITTTCTHKQLYGPRGGLIMAGQDHDRPAPTGSGTLADFLQRAVFPYHQGAPALNVIAAKARALAIASTPEFRRTGELILRFARALAECLSQRGYDLVAGGTENHTVLVDLRDRGVSGLVAERALEECGIVVNKNRVPGDTTPAHVCGGIRIGSNNAASRGMDSAQAVRCAELIDAVLTQARVLGPREYELAPSVRDEARAQVARLCEEFPLPNYPC